MYATDLHTPCTAAHGPYGWALSLLPIGLTRGRLERAHWPIGGPLAVRGMAKEPVRGMESEEKKAVATSSYQGQMYYFCAKACKQKLTSRRRDSSRARNRRHHNAVRRHEGEHVMHVSRRAILWGLGWAGLSMLIRYPKAGVAAQAKMLLASGAARSRVVYVANEAGRSLSVSDGETLQASATVPLPHPPITWSWGQQAASYI